MKAFEKAMSRCKTPADILRVIHALTKDGGEKVEDDSSAGSGSMSPEITRLLELVERQATQIELLVAGTQPKTVNLDQTFGEMWERYFKTLPPVQWRKSVESMMKMPVAKFASIKIGDFGPHDWIAFRDAPETCERYGPTSRNIMLTRIKIMLTRAVDGGELSKSPLQRTRPERGPGKRKTEITASDETLIADGLDQIMRAMFITAIDSAMRREEARRLEWHEIDFATRTVCLVAGRTKSKRERTAYLTTRVVKLLNGLPRYPNCPYVFANPDTLRPYSKTHLWNHFRKAVDGNGIKPAPGDGAVRWHDSRRTAVNRLIRLGAPIPAVQEILGHANLATTAMYVHAQRRDVLDAHALLNRSVSERSVPPSSGGAPVSAGGAS